MAKSVDCLMKNIEMPSAYMKTDPERTAAGKPLVNRVKRVGPSTILVVYQLEQVGGY